MRARRTETHKRRKQLRTMHTWLLFWQAVWLVLMT